MMERIENQLNIGYGKIYESLGKYVIINRLSYFNHVSYDMDLYKNNYYLMVNLLIKLTYSRNNL